MSNLYVKRLKENILSIILIIFGYILVFGGNFAEFILAAGFFFMALGFSLVLDSRNKEDIKDIKTSLKRLDEKLTIPSISGETSPLEGSGKSEQEKNIPKCIPPLEEDEGLETEWTPVEKIMMGLTVIITLATLTSIIFQIWTLPIENRPYGYILLFFVMSGIAYIFKRITGRWFWQKY
jgi:hypothetical protein